MLKDVKNSLFAIQSFNFKISAFLSPIFLIRYLFLWNSSWVVHAIYEMIKNMVISALFWEMLKRTTGNSKKMFKYLLVLYSVLQISHVFGQKVFEKTIAKLIKQIATRGKTIHFQTHFQFDFVFFWCAKSNHILEYFSHYKTPCKVQNLLKFLKSSTKKKKHIISHKNQVFRLSCSKIQTINYLHLPVTKMASIKEDSTQTEQTSDKVSSVVLYDNI